MEKYQLKNATLVGALALALTACSSSNDVATVINSAGNVVDGYVKNATVVLDQNDNKICETTEPTMLTDNNGNYQFAASLGQHMVCASGGTDIATGAPFVGQLKAPPGSTTVTPLTSLVQAQIDQDPTVTTANLSAKIAAASTQVATNLGLTNVNVLTADPIALATSNPKVLQTAVAVQVLVVQATNAALAGAVGTSATTEQTAELYKSALKGVAKAVAAQATAVDLTNSTQVATLATSAISNAVTQVQTDISAGATTTLTAAQKTAIANLAPASVAAVASQQVAAKVNTVATTSAVTLATASTSGVTNPALAAMTDNTTAQIVVATANLLTNAVANSAAGTGSNAANSVANLANLASGLLTAITNKDTTTLTNLVNTQIAAVNTAAPTLTIKNISIPTGAVAISGAPVVGNLLTASNTLADSNGLGSISYVWRTNGVPIPFSAAAASATAAASAVAAGQSAASAAVAATAAAAATATAAASAAAGSYTLAQTDVGNAISVTAMYVDGAGAPKAVTSPATGFVTAAGVSVPTGAVKVTNAFTFGSNPFASNAVTYTADASAIQDTNGTGAFSYQWLSSGTPIAGATSSTYSTSLFGGGFGGFIGVLVSYVDGKGVKKVLTGGSGTVSQTIYGNPIVGNTLSVCPSNALVSVCGSSLSAIQWYSGASAVTGASNSSYTVAQADVGKSISYVAQGAISGYIVGTPTAAVTAAPAAPTLTGSVTINNPAPRVGDTLLASNNLSNSNGIPSGGAGAIAYTWRTAASGVAATAVGTGVSYTVQPSDLGKTITATANYTDNTGIQQASTSTPTAAVAGKAQFILANAKINNTAVAGDGVATPFSVTVTGPMNNASVNLTAVGAPTIDNTKAAFAAQLVEAAGGSGRQLMVVMNNGVMLANNSGVLSATVAAGATLYVYGKNHLGTTFAATLTNVAANFLTTDASGNVSVNWANLNNALAAQSGGFFAAMPLTKGTFNATIVVGGITAIATQVGTAAPVSLNNQTITPTMAVGGTTPAAITAPGVTMTVTVQ